MYRSRLRSGGQRTVGGVAPWILPHSLILAAIFVWGIISGLERRLSTPIFFVAVGLILGEGLKVTG